MRGFVGIVLMSPVLLALPGPKPLLIEFGIHDTLMSWLLPLFIFCLKQCGLAKKYCCCLTYIHNLDTNFTPNLQPCISFCTTRQHSLDLQTLEKFDTFQTGIPIIVVCVCAKFSLLSSLWCHQIRFSKSSLHSKGGRERIF